MTTASLHDSTQASSAGQTVITSAFHAPVRCSSSSKGWLWQEKAALRLIGEHYCGAKLLAARSVYIALTEIASDQHTQTKARAACSYIGSRAGVSEGTARRYLHELAALGIVAIEANGNRAFNTYHLLAVSVPERGGLAASTMTLADGKGISSRPLVETRGITGASLTQTETPASAPLDGARGITDAPQIKKKDSKTKNKQTGLVSHFDGRLDVGDVTTSAVCLPTPPPPAEEISRAVSALTGIGVRLEVAKQSATFYPLSYIRVWVAYALRAQGLKNRAGFVLAMLKAGQEPPAIGGKPCWVPPSADQQGSTPPACPPIEDVLETEPPSPRDIAAWQVVRGDLLTGVSAAVRIWLGNVRLIELTDGRALLSSPPVGVARRLEAAYQDDITRQLGGMLGRDITVEFRHGW